MESSLTASLLFESPRPPAESLPHLITVLDAELIGKVTQLTKSKPGLWNVPAPFDEHDVFDNLREAAPLAAWALPLNQGEVQAFGPLVAEAVFGVKLMLLDSASDEPLLARLAMPQGHRIDTGAYVTPGYEDLPELPRVLESTGWVLIPVGSERSLGLFVVNSAKADLVEKLCEWCEREGRNHAKLQREDNQLVVRAHPAPDKYRANAMGHHIDAFLSDMELAFGQADETILPLIAERIESKRRLREQIEKAKTTG